MLEQIQRDLFALGARLAILQKDRGTREEGASPAGISAGSRELDRSARIGLPPLRRFILAGGTRTGAALHVSRTICRRAERSMFALGNDAVEQELVTYINRLLRLLFVMGRAATAGGQRKRSGERAGVSMTHP